ncbi:MAG: hypothetical protein WBN31_14725 [Gammaproteobacteria bacterium]
MMHRTAVLSVCCPLLISGVLFASGAIAEDPTAAPAVIASADPLLAAVDEQPTRRKQRPVPAQVEGKFWGSGVWEDGCVSCHSDASDGGYQSLGVLLQRVGHGIPPNHVKTVPNGCQKCHKDGGAAYPLGTLIHEIHFENPRENAYVNDFKGSCIGCHRMNTERGSASLKRGKRNW